MTSTSHTAVLLTAPGTPLADTVVPTPVPGKDEVLVRLEYTTFVPLDVEISEKPDFQRFYPFIPGINIAGVVEKLGTDVEALAIGDKVTGFAIPTYGYQARGAQEYAVIPWHALAKVTLPLEDAVTIPDNFVTAWWTFTQHLKLPLSPAPASGKQRFSDASFLIYGASSTTGQYMLQVLALYGCTRVIAVASRANHPLLRTLGATHTIDYRDADWATQVRAANGGRAMQYVVDIIGTDASMRGLATTVDAQSQVAILLPMKLGQAKIIAEPGENARLVWELSDDENPFPKEIELGYVRTFNYYQNEYLKYTLLPTVLPSLLASGAIRPATKKVITEPGSSLAARVKTAFDLLRTNTVSGQKVVVDVNKSRS